MYTESKQKILLSVVSTSRVNLILKMGGKMLERGNWLKENLKNVLLRFDFVEEFEHFSHHLTLIFIAKI